MEKKRKKKLIEMADRKEKLVHVISGGRITIPHDLRREMEIADGDWVLMSLQKAKINADKKEKSDE